MRKFKGLRILRNFGNFRAIPSGFRRLRNTWPTKSICTFGNICCTLVLLSTGRLLSSYSFYSGLGKINAASRGPTSLIGKRLNS